jgi:hypothetical protein
MKKVIVLAIILCVGWLINPTAKGATPLTDFTFHSSYHNIRLVNEAYKHKTFTDSMMIYLDENNPIDSKIALINALGWINGQKKNGILFLTYLKKKYAVNDSAALVKELSADELLCLAYLSAMANYNYVSNAVDLAKLAVKKNKKSFAFQFIYQLLKAQEISWIGTMNCKIYKNYKTLRENPKIKKDMKFEAMDEIYAFYELYVNDCK